MSPASVALVKTRTAGSPSREAVGVQDGRVPPIPNGRSQASAAGLDTLPTVAGHRSLGDTPAPAASPAPLPQFP